MPMPSSYYPPGWNAFSARIRHGRAGDRCECFGQCGLHHGRRCAHANHTPGRWQRGTIVLTVAHLCACSPICLNPAHVIAACQRCHLRIDAFKHAKTRKHHAHDGTHARANARRALRPPGEPCWPGAGNARNIPNHVFSESRTGGGNSHTPSPPPPPPSEISHGKTLL